jgi:hypothetical protein
MFSNEKRRTPFIGVKQPGEDGKVYAVTVNGDCATIKRVRRLANGCELLPESTDPTYRPELYDFSEEGTPEVRSTGRVVWYTGWWSETALLGHKANERGSFDGLSERCAI